MKKIKAIFFDAGGVLFTTDFSSLKEKFIKKFHFSPLLFSDYPKTATKSFQEVTAGKSSYKEALFQIGNVQGKDKQEVYNYYKKVYIQFQKIDKKILNLIKKLSKRYNVYCLTNTVDLPLQINRETGLFSIFKKVYGSCEIKVRKPNKKAFLIPLKELELAPQEALFIDDGLENIKTAKEIGMNVIHFQNSSQLIKDLKKLELI